MRRPHLPLLLVGAALAMEGRPRVARAESSAPVEAPGASDPATAGPAPLLVPIGETLATQLVMMEWSRHVMRPYWSDVTLRSVERNLRGGWELDGDPFWANQVGHVYQGTFPYIAARSSGYGFWASAPFAFAGSALWEVAGETQPPSVNDQVTTTLSGIVIGEILYRFAGALRAEGGAWNDLFASILAPVGALNHQLVGTSQIVQPPQSSWQLALGGLAYSGPEPPGGPTLPYLGLSFTYGLPWSPALALEQPFDHFTVEASTSTSRSPIATVFARGLVAGATFGSEESRGLYGAFLSYDVDTPPGHRFSTSAIGFGASAGTALASGVRVDWDAVASAVVLGAGGTSPAQYPDGRDYRFGPGEQALVAVRIHAGDRATAGISLRQYLLFVASGGSGSESLLRTSASATLRLVGRTGIGVEVTRYDRDAEVSGDRLRQGDSLVRMFVFAG